MCGCIVMLLCVWNDKKVAMVNIVWRVAWILGLYVQILFRAKRESYLRGELVKNS